MGPLDEPGEVIVFLVMLWFYGFSIVGGIIRWVKK